MGLGAFLQSGWSYIRGWAAGATDVVYPGTCAVCEAFYDGGGPLCGKCAAALREQEQAPACARCAMPLAYPAAPCPWCLGKGRRPLECVLRLGIFDEPLKTLIHQMKYHRRWSLGEILAEHLAAKSDVRAALARAERIVPVPLHWKRHLLRGYNQAEVIAGALARHCTAKVVRALKRIRDTDSQTRLHGQKPRFENVKGAFVLARPKAIVGKHVIVVDDVTTSGATIMEVGRTLLAAKPASLSAIVVAVADPRGRGFTRV